MLTHQGENSIWDLLLLRMLIASRLPLNKYFIEWIAVYQFYLFLFDRLTVAVTPHANCSNFPNRNCPSRSIKRDHTTTTPRIGIISPNETDSASIGLGTESLTGATLPTTVWLWSVDRIATLTHRSFLFRSHSTNQPLYAASAYLPVVRSPTR